MKQPIVTPQMMRQRKMLLVLPLLMLPFLTLFFWALDGGIGNQPTSHNTVQRGLNTQLPEANLKDNSTLNKMSYYEQAALDSGKLRQQLKSDPYYHDTAVSNTPDLHFPQAKSEKPDAAGQVYKPSKLNAGDNADKVYQKLAQLQTAINKPPAKPRQQAIQSAEETEGPLKNVTPQEDPELRQMNGLLEKIVDIQHPGRVKEKSAQAANPPETQFRAIPAIIDGKQKITQGSVVRLKLLDTVTLNGHLIPKGQLIFGSGELYNQRLTLHLQLIRLGYIILPVDLTVFDMTDGLEGINVPEAVTGDAVKDGAVSGVQGMELISLDPSLTGQLAGAGLNTAKSLFGKKVKRIKAKLKDGYLLLLRNNQKPAPAKQQ